MKISIIIPIYNVAPFILRCLESVSNQTYPNIECILIDDHCTDDSIRYVEDFINKNHDTIDYIIIHHKCNQGLSCARNTGIDNASGDYVFFLDGDDAITYDCIEKLVSLAIKYPNADLIQGNTVTGSKELMPVSYKTKAPEYCDNREMLEELLLSTTITTAWNKLIKSSFLKDNKLYFPIGIIMEDTYWSYFLVKKVKAAAFTNDQTYYYYNNTNSIINLNSNYSRKKRIEGIMIGVHAFINDMIEEGYSTKQQRLYLASNMVICMTKITTIKSITIWIRFWKIANKVYFQSPHKKTRYDLLLYLFMIPPLCVLAYIKGWSWRLNHYIASKI